MPGVTNKSLHYIRCVHFYQTILSLHSPSRFRYQVYDLLCHCSNNGLHNRTSVRAETAGDVPAETADKAGVKAVSESGQGLPRRHPAYSR